MPPTINLETNRNETTCMETEDCLHNSFINNRTHKISISATRVPSTTSNKFNKPLTHKSKVEQIDTLLYRHNRESSLLMNGRKNYADGKQHKNINDFNVGCAADGVGHDEDDGDGVGCACVMAVGDRGVLREKFNDVNGIHLSTIEQNICGERVCDIRHTDKMQERENNTKLSFREGKRKYSTPVLSTMTPTTPTPTSTPTVSMAANDDKEEVEKQIMFVDDVSEDDDNSTGHNIYNINHCQCQQEYEDEEEQEEQEEEKEEDDEIEENGEAVELEYMETEQAINIDDKDNKFNEKRLKAHRQQRKPLKHAIRQHQHLSCAQCCYSNTRESNVMKRKCVSHSQYNNMRKTSDLISVAIKMVNLIKRNNILQQRLTELQTETAEFIQSVLANPENSHLRKKFSDSRTTRATDTTPTTTPTNTDTDAAISTSTNKNTAASNNSNSTSSTIIKTT